MTGDHVAVATVLAFLISYGFSSCAGLAEDRKADADWKGKLFAEGPKCWARFEKLAGTIRLVGTRSDVATFADGAKTERIEEVDLQVNQSQIRQIRKFRGNDGRQYQQVVVIGPKYLFRLMKLVSEDVYKVDYFGPLVEAEKMRSGIDYKHMAIVSVPSTFGQPFESLRDPRVDPHFKITGVQQTEVNGERLVRLEFTYDASDSVREEKNFLAEDGWMLFDPNGCWVVREVGLNTRFQQDRGQTVTSIEYQDLTDGLPIPKRFVQINRRTGASGEMKFEYTKVDRQEIAAAEFTLSAFGLPEMEVSAARGVGRAGYYYVGVGLCLGLVAAIVVWRGRVRRREST